jgi:hypothetical protein
MTFVIRLSKPNTNASAPVLGADESVTAGGLLMLDVAHSSFPSGALTSELAVPNMVQTQAQALLDTSSTFPFRKTSGGSNLARTAAGGVILTAQNHGIEMIPTVQQAIADYLYNSGSGRNFAFSFWIRYLDEYFITNTTERRIMNWGDPAGTARILLVRRQVAGSPARHCIVGGVGEVPPSVLSDPGVVDGDPVETLIHVCGNRTHTYVNGTLLDGTATRTIPQIPSGGTDAQRKILIGPASDLAGNRYAFYRLHGCDLTASGLTIQQFLALEQETAGLRNWYSAT